MSAPDSLYLVYVCVCVERNAGCDMSANLARWREGCCEKRGDESRDDKFMQAECLVEMAWASRLVAQGRRLWFFRKKDERISLVCFQSAGTCFFLQEAASIDGEERSD